MIFPNYKGKTALFNPKPIVRIIIYIIALAISVIVICLALNLFTDTSSWIATTGTIAAVNKSSTTIKYVVDAVEHIATVNESSDAYYIGMQVAIKYNPKDFSQIVMDVNNVKIIVVVIASLVGAGVLIAAITDFAKLTTKRYQTASITANGVNQNISLDFVCDKFEEGSESLYYYYPIGDSDESYLVVDDKRVPVYELKRTSASLFKGDTYDFKNLLTGETSTHRVSHGVGTSVGFDGVSDMHEYLMNNGYSYTRGASYSTPVNIFYKSAMIAKIEFGGTSIEDPSKKDNPIANMPVQGYYKIHTTPANLNATLLIAFMFSKSR